jgi:hypothetical protein
MTAPVLLAPVPVLELLLVAPLAPEPEGVKTPELPYDCAKAALPLRRSAAASAPPMSFAARKVVLFIHCIDIRNKSR